MRKEIKCKSKGRVKKCLLGSILFVIGAAALSGGRILTSRENKKAFSERFEEELNQVLARRENQER